MDICWQTNVSDFLLLLLLSRFSHVRLCVGKEVKELELVYSGGYIAKWCSHYGKQSEVS